MKDYPSLIENIIIILIISFLLIGITFGLAKVDILNEKEQLITYLTIGMLTILSLLVLSLYKNNNLRTKAYELLQAKNTELIIAKDNVEKALRRYTFLKLDKHLITAVRSYLVFFSEYLQDSKDVRINIYTGDTEEGLNISFDFPDNVNEETLKSWFNEYLEFLKTDINDLKINTVESVTKQKADLLILKLKEQISHFKQSILIAQIETNRLKNENDFLRDITKLLSVKTDKLFITSGSDNVIIDKQGSKIDSELIISNSSVNNVSISNIESLILKTIENSSYQKNDVENLKKQLDIIKSNQYDDSKKKKSGSILRKFLDSLSTESAKKIIEFISTNAEDWIEYLK